MGERQKLTNRGARVRIWTIDEMDWVIALKSTAVGDEIQWAGKLYVLVRHQGELRVRLKRGEGQK